MKTLRVIDPAGNNQDYDTEFVPRIGERIVLVFGRGDSPIVPHFYRVKDVAYHLDNAVEYQASILIEDEPSAEHWPQ